MFGKKKFTDAEIVENIRNGDQKMLLLLHRRNHAIIARYVNNNSGQQADAEDMLQEALIVFWLNVQKPGFELSAAIDTYLFSICKNLWLKQIRKNQRIQNQDFEAENNIFQLHAQQTENNQHTEVLQACLQQLGTTCRKLLQLFYFEQWNMEQIAEHMHFANAQTAKAKKYQCKKQLETIVKKQYTAEDLL